MFVQWSEQKIMVWLQFAIIATNLIFTVSGVDRLTCYSPVRLAYQVKEPASGTNPNLNPVLFLHKIYFSKEYWFEIPQTVADRTGRKVYVLDARDHGDSEQSECFSINVLARDVMQFMDEQGIQKAVLVGHTLGGSTAYKVALEHYNRVEKVIIEDYGPKALSSDNAQSTLQFVLLAEEAAQHVPYYYSLEEANQFVTDYVYDSRIYGKANGVSTVPVNKTRYFPLKRSESGGYTSKANMSVLIHDLSGAKTPKTDNTGVFNGSALFIYGTESAFKVFDDALNILNHFPNAQFLPILGSNNEVHNNFPNEFTEYILKFILQ